jgi:hypothetical protein
MISAIQGSTRFAAYSDATKLQRAIGGLATQTNETPQQIVAQLEDLFADHAIGSGYYRTQLVPGDIPGWSSIMFIGVKGIRSLYINVYDDRRELQEDAQRSFERDSRVQICFEKMAVVVAGADADKLLEIDSILDKTLFTASDKLAQAVEKRAQELGVTQQLNHWQV